MTRAKRLLISSSNTIRLYGVLLLLGSACSTGADSGAIPPSDSQSESLVGRWRKTTSDPCAALYPDEIEFFKDTTTYLAQKGASQSFIIWDAGSYRIEKNREVTLSTATDALVTYPFTLASKTLTFVDANNCRFTYERA